MSMRSAFWEPKPKPTAELKPILKKYYMEVVGASKDLYTVKAHDVQQDSCGSYIFYLDGEIIASYPIARTIIKSIEDKSNE